jgi:hypothetical protein
MLIPVEFIVPEGHNFNLSFVTFESLVNVVESLTNRLHVNISVQQCGVIIEVFIDRKRLNIASLQSEDVL